MLLRFTVKNYKSFKEAAALSMEASSDGDHPENLAYVGKSPVLKSAAVFGANGAGKSCLADAAAAAVQLVRLSSRRQPDDELSEVVPFLFDPDSAAAPTEFEFVFTAADGLRYVYGFSATGKEVRTEYLYRYRKDRASVIFERDAGFDPEYSFPDKGIRRDLERITARGAKNRLFLATATSWNAEVTRAPYLWLASSLDIFRPAGHADLPPEMMDYYVNDTGGSLRSFTRQLLNEADTGISDYEIRHRKIPPDLGGPLFQDGKHHRNYELITTHTVRGAGGSPGKYTLNLREESAGVRDLFAFSPVLRTALSEGRTVFADGLDADLHPLLVTYILGLFHNPAVNRNNAQLILSGHATDLLSRDVLRRDQVYFAARNRVTSASELFPLGEFSEEEGADIRKAYLEGVYGAVPELGPGEIQWQ